jgi:hypothetical protein
VEEEDSGPRQSNRHGEFVSDWLSLIWKFGHPKTAWSPRFFKWKEKSGCHSLDSGKRCKQILVGVPRISTRKRIRGVIAYPPPVYGTNSSRKAR